MRINTDLLLKISMKKLHAMIVQRNLLKEKGDFNNQVKIKICAYKLT